MTDPASDASQSAVVAEDSHHEWRGRALVVIAAVLWSSNGFFVKWPIFEDWPQETRGVTLAFWRALFAALCLIPAVRRPRWDVRLLPMAGGFTLMNITFLTSMTLTTTANAIWLQNTAPLWILLSGAFLYHEPFDRRNLTPLVTGLAGALLIVICEMVQVSSATSQAGVLYGVASGACYALVVVSMRRLRAMDTAWLIALNHVTAALCLGPYIWSLGIFPRGIQWPVLLAFGGLQMALPYFLFARGLRRISSQEGAAVGLLEPILAPVWVLYWGEWPAWWTVVGGGLILVGLVARYARMRNWVLRGE